MAQDSAPASPLPKESVASPTEPTTAESSAQKGKKPGFSFSALSPKEKNIVRIAGFFACLTMIDVVIVRPVGNYLNQLNEKIEREKRILPKKLLMLNYKEQLLKDYKQLLPLMTDDKLSEEEEIAQLLREIERVTKQTALFVANINPVKRTSASAESYELSVEVEGTGTIQQIVEFMQIIEGDNPPLRIREFAMSPKGKDPSELKFTFTVVKLGVRKGSAEIKPEESKTGDIQ